MYCILFSSAYVNSKISISSSVYVTVPLTPILIHSRNFQNQDSNFTRNLFLSRLYLIEINKSEE